MWKVAPFAWDGLYLSCEVHSATRRLTGRAEISSLSPENRELPKGLGKGPWVSKLHTYPRLLLNFSGAGCLVSTFSSIPPFLGPDT